MDGMHSKDSYNDKHMFCVSLIDAGAKDTLTLIILG